MSTTGAHATTAADRAVLYTVAKQLLIAGEWRDGAEGRTVAVEDPATGETIAEVADATSDDALDALAAAMRRSLRGARRRRASAARSCGGRSRGSRRAPTSSPC